VFSYWLRLLRDSQIASGDEIDQMIAGAEELIRILTAIVKSGQANVVAPQLNTQH
jgi:hypothetical protein